MLMAVGSLIREGWVECHGNDILAASGAGANNMRELLSQMGHLQSQVSRVGNTILSNFRYRS